MSIDARVDLVVHHEGGGGELRLIDRPPSRPGDTGGIAGQRTLRFDAAPHDVSALNGRDIWGGSGILMAGDREFARREGHTKIRFTVPGFSGWKFA